MMYCFVPRTLQFEASNSVCVHNNNIIHYRVAEVEESANSFPLAGLVFPLGELLDATDQKDEKNLLGRGGYGSVYRGVLRHITVAVKFLNEVRQSIAAEYLCEFEFAGGSDVTWKPKYGS